MLVTYKWKWCPQSRDVSGGYMKSSTHWTQAISNNLLRWHLKRWPSGKITSRGQLRGQGISRDSFFNWGNSISRLGSFKPSRNDLVNSGLKHIHRLNNRNAYDRLKAITKCFLLCFATIQGNTVTVNSTRDFSYVCWYTMEQLPPKQDMKFPRPSSRALLTANSATQQWQHCWAFWNQG